jgi:hypothetical protein
MVKARKTRSHRRELRPAGAHAHEGIRGTGNTTSHPRVRGRGSSLPGLVLVRTPLGYASVDLQPVAAALAKLDDGELCALIDATNNVPQIVPGLLAWIGHACDWELNRRADVDFPLRPPDAAVPPDGAAASIAAAMTLRARFDQDDERDAGAVVTLFDALIRVLTGGGCRH